jgi:hypothetical protein
MSSLLNVTDHDMILGLPITNIQPTQEELKIADTIFKTKSVAMNMQNDLKEIIVIVILFVIFSLPQTEVIISRLLPALKNFPYMITVVKVLLVVIFFWLIKNFSLSRSS